MSIVAWIALGLIAGSIVGWIAGLRGRNLLGDAVVGTLGAVLAGGLASVLLGLDISSIDPTSVLGAAVGALVLILVLHALPPTAVFD
jgi:uncharacterized membrane protein YeaQ/YmgE (transglycosylase-associated protein family)